MSFSSQGMTRNGGLGAALSIRNLTKRYGHGAPAVDDVSLDIQAGEFVTFLGPSGSGKTTTLSMVAGFTDVTSGQILLGGQPIEALPPHRRNIGMVFQSYSLFPHMSVFDNVAFPLRRRGIGKAEIRARVGRVLELIQLADKMDRYAPKSNDTALLGRVLIVPVRIGHQISTLELIDCEGRKSSLAGGAKAGGWWSVTPEQHRRDACLPVLIAEGVATAVSAWQATGWYTLAALSSGNLSKVATVWRAQHPKDALVILADLGAGFTHAEHAARNAHARLVVPRFASGAHIANQLPTDFNDMAVLDGKEAVGELLRRAVLETPAPTSTDAKASRTQTEGMSFYLTGDADMGSRKTDKGTGADDVRRHAEADRSDGDCASTQPSGTPEEGKQAFTHEPAASSVTETTDDGQHSNQGPRHATGELIYGLDAVPTEVKVAAERRFGAVLRMFTPRENGGPYRGEVLNTEHFLVQEVAPRSVVFHAKGRMTFVSDRLRWMDEHHRLNGADVQIVYEGERAKLYPWDRARDQLERAVASLKKSAREMGLDGMDAKLDALHAASWARVKAARADALAQARSRVDGRGDIDDPQR